MWSVFKYVVDSPDTEHQEPKQHINRHNGKPIRSRMILIASDKPQNSGKFKDRQNRQF